ncbi:hypothetical protein BGW38_001646 [Lunasporangiospora selenospora]|uniref:Zinc finger PHD-type domain-containing protein n=1 Tax=Lunasporangiospora selenospora TaxID=979761 RepID=A0A9P6KHZ3_9FUNG|nr:hypothetical protein BGW38_001646 [Lunasporangiospora selenospora]
MASPRRSNRGGHSKGKKKEDDDDGGQTRCVCNQQHHEGVMIQCEICKVWQHCPCVGLGDGEVTPDKYYCDSCRPENHPYQVQNGVLITNAKKEPQLSAAVAVTAASKAKLPKKRNTLNSKEASIPMELMLAQQKWNDEHMDTLEDVPRSSKRRRKTESSTDDDDVSKDNSNQDTLRPPVDIKSADSKKTATASNKDQEAPSSSSTSSSPRSSSSKSAQSKKSASKASSGTRPNSPPPNQTGESRTSKPQQQTSTSTADVDQSPHSKNSRTLDYDSVTPDLVVPSTKRRKTTSSKQETPSRGHSEEQEDSNDHLAKDSGDDRAEITSRSRKGGPHTKNASKKNNNNLLVANDHDDGQMEAGSPPSSHEVPTVVPSTKKSLHKKGTERGHGNSQRHSSRHSTPVLINEGTPQPSPASPTMVRYPSPKMTMQDMTKRAKQLLDYISRVQVDMADRKSRSGSSSPSQAASTPKMLYPDQRLLTSQLQRDTDLAPMVKEESFQPIPRSLGMGTVSVASDIHGDSQVCPDLSRSSMESSVDEPIGPLEMRSPVVGGAKDTKEMTIKVLPMEVHPLLSTPPLSVHEMSHLDHHGAAHDHGEDHDDCNGINSSNMDCPHAPLTPPHQPLELMQEDVAEMDVPESLMREEHSSERPISNFSSLELMDKLTGDLIRFQDKFGTYA